MLVEKIDNYFYIRNWLHWSPFYVLSTTHTLCLQKFCPFFSTILYFYCLASRHAEFAKKNHNKVHWLFCNLIFYCFNLTNLSHKKYDYSNLISKWFFACLPTFMGFLLLKTLLMVDALHCTQFFGYYLAIESVLFWKFLRGWV